MTWLEPTSEQRQIAWLWCIVAAGALVLRPFWLELAALLPPCPFRALTHLPCPSCGTTHAALALLHGHPGAALASNPLMALAGIGFLAGLFAPAWIVLGGRLPALPRPLPTGARAAAVAVILLDWAWMIWRS